MLPSLLEVSQTDEKVTTFLMTSKPGSGCSIRSFDEFWKYSSNQEFCCTELESFASFVYKWKTKSGPAATGYR